MFAQLCIDCAHFQLELQLEFQLEHSGTFWNILEQFVTDVMSVTDFQLELQLEHSGTFWNDL